MKKKVPVVKITTPDEAAGLAELPLSATVAMADVAESMREGLLAFATSAGLVVMQQMLTEELTSIVGAKHAKLPAGERVGNWHGSTRGQVVLGARKVTVERPRGRYVDDGGEVDLDTWDVFASEDLLRQTPRRSVTCPDAANNQSAARTDDAEAPNSSTNTRDDGNLAPDSKSFS